MCNLHDHINVITNQMTAGRLLHRQLNAWTDVMVLSGNCPAVEDTKLSWELGPHFLQSKRCSSVIFIRKLFECRQWHIQTLFSFSVSKTVSKYTNYRECVVCHCMILQICLHIRNNCMYKQNMAVKLNVSEQGALCEYAPCINKSQNNT